MKNYFIKLSANYFILSMFLILTLASCRQNSSLEALKLNNEVVALQDEIVEAFEAYTLAAMTDEEDLAARRLMLKEVAKKSMDKMQDYKVSKNNNAFITAARDNFEYYEDIATNDLVLVERWLMADSITVEQKDSLLNSLNDIRNREDKLDEHFKREQKKFSEKNKFKLAQ